MRKISGCLIFFFLCLAWSFGQNKSLLYDFMEIPQSLMLNPGVKADFKWYVGMPMLSGFSGYAGSSGLAANDIFANDGVDINEKFRERMLNGLSKRDEFSGAFQIEWLNIGYRSKNPDIFYSFGAYLDVDNITYWPRDYAFLAIDGNADQLNRKFDLSHFNAAGSVVNVYHFGFNKRVDQKLTIGARGKLYAGMVDYDATHNRGYLVNTQGENNLLATTLDADLKLRSSGFGDLNRADNDGALPGTLMKRAFFGGDLGIGIDLGVSKQLTDRTVLSASLLDLGLLYHSGDIYTYSLKGKATSEGIQINVLRDFANLNRDFWQDLVDDIEERIPFKTSHQAYINMRPLKFYGAVRHDFGEVIGNRAMVESCNCAVGASTSTSERAVRYKNSVGGQLYVINRARGPQPALTAFYQHRFGHILALKGTYTMDKFSFSNLGLGLNLQTGPINLYILADNLLSYQNLAGSRYASFQIGLNIISWGKK